MGLLATVSCLAQMLVGCAVTPPVEEKQARQDLQAVARVYRPQGEAPALPQLSGNSTLREYMLFAMLNQPQIRAAYFDWSAAVEHIVVERSLPDPRLTFQADIADTVMSLVPGLMMEFPGAGSAGKLQAAARVASAESAVKYHEFEALVQLTAYQLKKAYHELHFLQAKISVYKNMLNLMGDVERQARARHGAGQAGLQDVLLARMEQERLQTEIANLEDSLQPMQVQFKAALGMQGHEAMPPLPLHFESSPATPDDKQFSSRVLARNPRLKALDAEIRRAEASLQLAYKARVPDLSLGIEADVKASPIMFTPQIGITIPLWRKKIAAQLAQAQAGQEAAQARLSAEQINLAVEFAEKSFLYRESGRNLELLNGRLLPLASQSLELAHAGYAGGREGLPAVLDAERSLLDIQLQEIAARLQRELSGAELAHLILNMPPEQAPLLPAGEPSGREG